jgi:hypothetical protein
LWGLTFSFVADKSGVHFSWANVIKVARIFIASYFHARLRHTEPSTQKSVSGHLSTFCAEMLATKKIATQNAPDRQTENHISGMLFLCSV